MKKATHDRQNIFPEMLRALGLGVVLVGAISVAALPGCAKKQDSSDDAVAGEETPSLGAEKLLNQASVSCAPKSECPPSVAMVVAVHGAEVKMCTGFLASKEILVTASSCLPEALRKAGASCTGLVKIHFPKTTQLDELQVDCAQVVSASQPDLIPETLEGDFAYLRLDRGVNRAPLKIQSAAVDSRIAVTVPSVSVLSEGTTRGVVEVQHCDVAPGSIVLHNSEKGSGPFLVLGGCHGKASSGAPVIDSQGTVRALFHSDVSPTVMGALKSFALETPAELAFAANFLCLPSPLSSSSGELPKSCSSVVQKPLTTEEAGEVQIDPRYAEPEIRREIDAWNRENGKIFLWKSTYLPNSNRLTVEPMCFQATSSWVNDFCIHKLLPGAKCQEWTWLIESKASKKYVAKTWEVSSGFDQYLVRQNTVREVHAAQQEVTVQFNPKEAHTRRESKVILSYATPNQAPTQQEKPLDICNALTAIDQVIQPESN